MPSIITPNSIALYNEYTGDIWYVSRKTGEITPNHDIFYTGTSCLSLNCLHYAKQTLRRNSCRFAGKVGGAHHSLGR